MMKFNRPRKGHVLRCAVTYSVCQLRGMKDRDFHQSDVELVTRRGNSRH